MICWFFPSVCALHSRDGVRVFQSSIVVRDIVARHHLHFALCTLRFHAPMLTQKIFQIFRGPVGAELMAADSIRCQKHVPITQCTYSTRLRRVRFAPNIPRPIKALNPNYQFRFMGYYKNFFNIHASAFFIKKHLRCFFQSLVKVVIPPEGGIQLTPTVSTCVIIMPNDTSFAERKTGSRTSAG